MDAWEQLSLRKLAAERCLRLEHPGLQRGPGVCWCAVVKAELALYCPNVLRAIGREDLISGRSQRERTTWSAPS